MSQLLGSALVLGAFVLLSLGRFGPRDARYLLANAVGAALLAHDALELRQWGFLALELTWALASTQALATVLVSRRRARRR